MPQKLCILLVDDEPEIVELVGVRLRALGYQVLVAMDGEEALAQAFAQHPDLIILDVMLPTMDGYRVCSRLKRDVRTQKIPIVMFTAKTQGRDVIHSAECGADAFVGKPFKPEELVDAIQRLTN